MAAGDLESIIPSGSINGRNIKIAATASAGTTLHTCHATHFDEVYVWATNTDTVDRKLTLECGGTTSPDDLSEMTIPAEGGPILVLPGVRYTGSVVIKAFAAAANVINCQVNVNRYHTS